MITNEMVSLIALIETSLQSITKILGKGTSTKILGKVPQQTII